MKYFKWGVTVAVLLVLFSGCASLANTFGIASKEYVDEQLSLTREELSSDIQSNTREINATKSTVDEYAQAAVQLEGLIESIQQAVQTTDELKQLADVLEDRLANLPVETIRQLVGILEQYLQDK